MTVEGVTRKQLENLVRLAINDGEFIGRHGLSMGTPQTVIDVRERVAQERLRQIIELVESWQRAKR